MGCCFAMWPLGHADPALNAKSTAVHETHSRRTARCSEHRCLGSEVVLPLARGVNFVGVCNDTGALKIAAVSSTVSLPLWSKFVAAAAVSLLDDSGEERPSRFEVIS